MRGATVIPSTRSPAISAFQPTRPLRGATRTSKTWKPATRISTHAPLAGRDRDMTPEEIAELISTHAPLAGRDAAAAPRLRRIYVISTHAPLAGRDDTASPQPASHLHFNQRAPCGARRSRPTIYLRGRYFNPRAPCGARPGVAPAKNSYWLFQPTRPLRGAT